MFGHVRRETSASAAPLSSTAEKLPALFVWPLHTRAVRPSVTTERVSARRAEKRLMSSVLPYELSNTRDQGLSLALQRSTGCLVPADRFIETPPLQCHLASTCWCNTPGGGGVERRGEERETEGDRGGPFGAARMRRGCRSMRSSGWTCARLAGHCSSSHRCSLGYLSTFFRLRSWASVSVPLVSVNTAVYPAMIALEGISP